MCVKACVCVCTAVVTLGGEVQEKSGIVTGGGVCVFVCVHVFVCTLPIERVCVCVCDYRDHRMSDHST